MTTDKFVSVYQMLAQRSIGQHRKEMITYHGSLEAIWSRRLDEFAIVGSQKGFVLSRDDTRLWLKLALSC